LTSITSRRVDHRAFEQLTTPGRPLKYGTSGRGCRRGTDSRDAIGRGRSIGRLFARLPASVIPFGITGLTCKEDPVAPPPYAESFRPIADRMHAAGLPPSFIGSFGRYYDLLTLGQTGQVAEADIEPVTDLVDAHDIAADGAAVDQQVLGRVVLIKVNGGLGTSMGLAGAKSLLVVKDGLSFLDIIARQSVRAGVPLVLMNSFATDAESLAALRPYPDLGRGLPLSFVQHKVPKITRGDLAPVDWPAERELEWCPPGHGDIYAALHSSGMLEALLRAGRDIAFVSNADNLGANVDLGILGYFHTRELSFLMEVAARTETDRKGGHLARGRDGRLLLRESAQCPPADMDAFQDIARHPYFNTNNLWINLRVLSRLLAEGHAHLPLPMIRNPKTVDPRNPESTPVYQVETAMGAAISVFPGAAAIRVPRDRFAPVKTTNELLAVRSDAYILSDDDRVVPSPARRLGDVPLVDLDAAHFRFVSSLEQRFPHGAPSLVDCARCRIVGDFRFGRGVRLVDDVDLVNLSGHAVHIPDGAVLTGERRFEAVTGSPDS
jgi:UTP--glucose-1-phosphate uridylyltransferase